MATRDATHQLGAKVLEQLLSAPAEFERALPCSCGHQTRWHEMRPKQLITVLGPITSSDRITYARIVTKGRVRATPNWMSRLQNIRPACAA